MAVTIVRTPWIDDDGSGTTGTVLNNAIKTELYNQIDAALANLETVSSPGVSVVTTSGTIATLPIPAGSDDLVILLNPTGPVTIQNIAGASRAGQRLTLINHSDQKIDFVCLFGGAGLLNTVSSASTSIMQRGWASYIFDSSLTGLWRLVAHEQGPWITVPYNASDFTANTGSWTVDAAEQTVKYRLSGRALTVQVAIGTTTLSAPALPILRIPGGYSATMTPPKQFIRATQASGATAGMVQPNSATQLYLWPDIVGTNNFAAGTNTIGVEGLFTLEVV